MRLKWGSGFCPVLLRAATSRTRCLLLPKGSKISAPAGVYLLLSCFLWFCCPSVFAFGAENPLFSAVFRPVCGFQRRGGILTLPQRRKRHTGATAGFTVFTVCEVYCFASVFSATNKEKRSAATVFGIPFQCRRRSRTVSLLHFCCGFVTDCFFKKSYCHNWFRASATLATHFCQQVLSRMRSAISR